MADQFGQYQLQTLNNIELHLEIIEGLIQDGDSENQQLWSQAANENAGYENSAPLSAISRYVGKIRKLIKVEKRNLDRATLSQKLVKREGFLRDRRSSRDKALTNHLVLHTLMTHLDAPSILNARLVSKAWEKEATIQLSSSELHRVEFQWHETWLQFQNKVGRLAAFTEKWDRDPLRKFPYPQFHFYFKKVLKTESEAAPADLSDFLAKYGHQIKSLYLQSSSNSASALKILKKVIFDCAPNLRSLSLTLPLYLAKSYFQPQDTESSSEKCQSHHLSLPKLQKITFEQEPQYLGPLNPLTVSKHCQCFMRDIFSAAPNLKQITDPHFRFTDEIVVCGKITAIKTLQWSKKQSALPGFVKLVQAGPQLTFLKLDLRDFINAGNSLDDFSRLQTIFESSQKTLKSLHICGRLDFDIENFSLDIPILENLIELRIEEWSLFENGRGRILPLGFSIQTSFPKLKSLSFHGIRFEYGWTCGYGNDGVDGDKVDHPFDVLCNSSLTVENFTLTPKDHSFDADRLTQGRVLYPNVRVLRLELKEDLSLLVDVLRVVATSWTDSLLEKLCITVEQCVSEELEYYKLPDDADHYFTGFDRDTCRMLRERPGSGQLYQGEEYKRGPAILDMKKLVFQLNAHPFSRVCFSRVSVIHAFEPMQQRQKLKVLIDGVDIEDVVQRGDVYWKDLERSFEDD